MKIFSSEKIVRENIRALRPYSSARNEFKGIANIYLDANENNFGSPVNWLQEDESILNFHRYPDPYQLKLKQKISQIKGVPIENVFIGNGSDEIIDLAFRIFCEPAKDNVIICPPTYGMYKVCANINEVEVKEVPLNAEFQPNVDAIFDAVDPRTKMLFLCSPNNPTGTDLQRHEMIRIIQEFPGIVIVDEAYINFSKQQSLIPELMKSGNLLIMQTLSKAWGLAGLRLGMAFGSVDVLDWFIKVKPPYNISEASQLLALEALGNIETVNKRIQSIVAQKEFLTVELQKLSAVKNIYSSGANFILVQTTDATSIYEHLLSKGIVVRNRTNEMNCENCLRISIGTPAENQMLLQAFKSYQ